MYILCKEAETMKPEDFQDWRAEDSQLFYKYLCSSRHFLSPSVYHFSPSHSPAFPFFNIFSMFHFWISFAAVNNILLNIILSKDITEIFQNVPFLIYLSSLSVAVCPLTLFCPSLCLGKFSTSHSPSTWDHKTSFCNKKQLFIRNTQFRS